MVTTLILAFILWLTMATITVILCQMAIDEKPSEADLSLWYICFFGWILIIIPAVACVFFKRLLRDDD